MEEGSLQRQGPRGKQESDVQLCFSSRECLKLETCLATVLPKVNHMGKLVLDKSLGSRGSRSLGGHGS